MFWTKLLWSIRSEITYVVSVCFIFPFAVWKWAALHQISVCPWSDETLECLLGNESLIPRWPREGSVIIRLNRPSLTFHCIYSFTRAINIPPVTGAETSTLITDVFISLFTFKLDMINFLINGLHKGRILCSLVQGQAGRHQQKNRQAVYLLENRT